MATSGSFSAAARDLGCTQPAVSQQMKALETSVGTPLLVRTGRETRLTQAGEALVRHANGILAGLTAAEEEVAAIAGLRAGRVRLVSFPSGSSTLVPTALAALRAAHPGTRVSLEEAEPPRSVELLREGDCDVALAFRYEDAADRDAAGAEEWADLVVRPLLTDRLVALVPERHRLARAGSGPVAIAELADEPWIAGCPRCRGQLVEVCASAGFTPRIDFATDDYPGGGPGLGGAPASAVAVLARNFADRSPYGPRGLSTTVLLAPGGAAGRMVALQTFTNWSQVPGRWRATLGRTGAGRGAVRRRAARRDAVSGRAARRDAVGGRAVRRGRVRWGAVRRGAVRRVPRKTVRRGPQKVGHACACPW
ncbi:transcriptional regulator [Streptomyces sp. e14]|nr:transcriptional regulator [Streptomyces sp. e14]